MLSAQGGAWTAMPKSPHNADRRQLHPAPQPLAETPKKHGSPHADRAVMYRILPPSARGKSHAERRVRARSPGLCPSLSVTLSIGIAPRPAFDLAPFGLVRRRPIGRW